jgi:endonuclease YncB( thermonuclease family)
MHILRDGKEERIRLSGIDAPELKQQLREASRNNLQSLVKRSNNQVRLTVVDIDRYGQEVAEVSSLSRTVLNVEHIRAAMTICTGSMLLTALTKLKWSRQKQQSKQSKQGIWNT